MISAIVYYTHDSITTVTANMIYLANEPTPYPIAPPKKWNTTSSSLFVPVVLP